MSAVPNGGGADAETDSTLLRIMSVKVGILVLFLAIHFYCISFDIKKQAVSYQPTFSVWEYYSSVATMFQVATLYSCSCPNLID